MLFLQYATAKLWKVIMESLYSKSLVLKRLDGECDAHLT